MDIWRWIIKWKKNGKGKEYDILGYLQIEGEYLSCYKLIGKLYRNFILENEGEYLYDIKWNGKGYDKNDNIIYEFINGNSKVKEYNDYTGELYFEGEYLNGQRNGKGKTYLNNGKLKFEGEYLNGQQRNGKGKEYDYYSNIQLEGEYLNGKRV